MNVLVRYKGTILFSPDAIYCEGVMIKAKKRTRPLYIA